MSEQKQTNEQLKQEHERLRLELEKARMEKELDEIKSGKTSSFSNYSETNTNSDSNETKTMRKNIKGLVGFSWLVPAYFVLYILFLILLFTDVFYKRDSYGYYELNAFYWIYLVAVAILLLTAIIGIFVFSIKIIRGAKHFGRLKGLMLTTSIVGICVFGIDVLMLILNFIIGSVEFLAVIELLSIIAIFVLALVLKSQFNKAYGKENSSSYSPSDSSSNYYIEED